MRPQLALAALLIPTASCAREVARENEKRAQDGVKKIDCRQHEGGYCGWKWASPYRESLLTDIIKDLNVNATFKDGQILGCTMMSGMQRTGYCARLEKYKKKEIPGTEVFKLAKALKKHCGGCGTAWSNDDGPTGGGVCLNFYEGSIKPCKGGPGIKGCY